MWERVKFWMRKDRDCKGCCLGCGYYEMCRTEVYGEALEREAYERDIRIETVVSEKRSKHFMRSA